MIKETIYEVWMLASAQVWSMIISITLSSIIIFYSTHSAISMAHAHVLREGWKNLRLLKYETIAWLVIGVVHNLNILCGEDGA